MNNRAFEILIKENFDAVDKFIKFKLINKVDAEDVLQETLFTAYRKFHQLKNHDSFKAWILSIARNKVNDYFRERAKALEIPIESVGESALGKNRQGISEINTVRDTLSTLQNKDKQILYLYYFKEMPQADIAKALNIPLGTVKSRLHTAKNSFKENYPFKYDTKGTDIMKKFPDYEPIYKITRSDDAPFDLKWEEMYGWFIIPKLHEKTSFAFYDHPERKYTGHIDLEVKGKAQVHGIEGVLINAKEYGSGADYTAEKYEERNFVAQLTDTHCRILAESHEEDGIIKYFTFLDGSDFLDNWGFGEDNCGNETNLASKGDIKKDGNVITTAKKDFLLDIAGRYTVEIDGKCFDTVCVIDIEKYNGGVMSEQYITKEGRTVLWRRFNRNDWAIRRYGKLWTEKLPENERRTVNGETFVHWYDCIPDNI